MAAIPPRALELLSAGLRANLRGSGELAGFAGRIAAERGCDRLGPVQIGPSTWAHRDASGHTQLWHRRPTATEVRALRKVGTPVPAVRSLTPKATAPKANEHARRVARLFS